MLKTATVVTVLGDGSNLHRNTVEMKLFTHWREKWFYFHLAAPLQRINIHTLVFNLYQSHTVKKIKLVWFVGFFRKSIVDNRFISLSHIFKKNMLRFSVSCFLYVNILLSLFLHDSTLNIFTLWTGGWEEKRPLKTFPWASGNINQRFFPIF